MARSNIKGCIILMKSFTYNSSLSENVLHVVIYYTIYF